MWLPEPPPADKPLRQGDLLKDVTFPRLKLPLAVSHVPGEKIDFNKHSLSVGATSLVGLVVTQCCDIENGKFVAVAAVRSTPPLKEELRQALLAEEPSSAGENPFVFDQFRLAPLAGIVEESPDRFTVAWLTEVIAFSGDRVELQEKRVAGMTPKGRRLLRINLAALWGRVEEGDLPVLKEEGLPPGSRP